MRKLAFLLLLMVWGITAQSQSPGCDINAIRTAFTGAGYIELPVPTQPCSMYFINPNTQSSAQAEAAAQQFGAHTVSLQSAQENADVLAAMYNGPYSPANYAVWIGISDGAQEGNFVWLDGAPVTYTNWAGNEPNDLHPSCCNIPFIGCVPPDSRCANGEDCVQMYGDGSWNDLGCDVSSISLIEVNLCPQITATPDTLACVNATITLAASTILGSTPYTYTWTPGGGNAATFAVTPTAATTYSVHLVDRWGCFADESVNVTTQTCTVPPITSTCNINAIRTAFTGAGYIELSVPTQTCSMYFINPTSQSSTASEAAAQQFGAHTVAIQTAQENTDIITALNLTPYSPANNTIWIGFSDIASEGNFIWLDGAPVTYTNWEGGEPNNVIPGCCSIPFFGCSGSNPQCNTGEDCVQMYGSGTWNDLPCGNASISLIEVNLCPVVTASNDVSVCGGVQVNLSATTILGSTPYVYNWMPGNSSANPYQVTPATTTQYNVRVNDRWGCLGEDSVVVTILGGAAQTFTVSLNPVCENSPVTVTYTSTSPSNATYTWGFDGGTVLSGSGQGPYQVVWSGSGTKNITLDVTDNGCVSQQVTQTLTISPLPVANAGPDVTVCSGGSVQLGSATTPGYVYQWVPATNLTPAAVSNPTYSSTNSTGAPVTTQYILGVAQGTCGDLDTVLVTVNPPGSTTISAAGSTAICSGQTLIINSDSVYTTYLWSDNTNGTAMSVTQAGTYTLSATGADGCQVVSNSITVTMNPALTISLVTSTDENCFGSADGSITVSASNGLPAYVYAWNTVPQQDSSIALNLSAGSYTVTVTDANTCSGTGTYSISSPTQVQFNTATVVDASCFGTADGSITAAAMGGTSPYTFAWSNGGAGNPLQNIAQGPYDVTVTDAHSCTTSATYNVGSPAELVLSVDALDNVSCFGLSDGSVQVSATGGNSPYNFDWSTGATGSTLSNVPAGNYSVTVSDVKNCNDDTAVVIAEPNEIVFSSLQFDSLKYGKEATLNTNVQPAGTYTYQWNPAQYLSCSDCPAPVFSAIRSIDYRVTVTDAFGCSVAATVKVNVIADKKTFIPNAFTPGNGDNINDVFTVFTETVRYYHLTIFNRIGEKVFDSFNETEGWDGTYRNEEAQAGVYSYVLNLTFLDGENEKFIGSVTLLR